MILDELHAKADAEIAALAEQKWREALTRIPGASLMPPQLLDVLKFAFKEGLAEWNRLKMELARGDG